MPAILLASFLLARYLLSLFGALLVVSPFVEPIVYLPTSPNLGYTELEFVTLGFLILVASYQGSRERPKSLLI